jgi:hypothetical protein
MWRKSYQITPNKIWSNVNYKDTSYRYLELEAVGGRCNRVLGKTTVNITFNYPTCKWQYPVTFDSWFHKVRLPALLLGVKFAGVKGKPEVLPYFQKTKGQKRFIDMLSPPPAPEVKKA